MKTVLLTFGYNVCFCFCGRMFFELNLFDFDKLYTDGICDDSEKSAVAICRDVDGNETGFESP